LLVAPRSWPLYLLSALAAHLAFDVLWRESSVWGALGHWAASTAEATAGAALLRRYLGGPVRMDRLRDVVALFLLPAVVSGCLTVAVGAATLALTDRVPVRTVGPAWWVAHTLGVAVFAPLILVWGTPEAWRRWWPARREAVEAAALVLAVVALVLVVAGPFASLIPLRPYALFPFMLLAGGRFGARGASL